MCHFQIQLNHKHIVLVCFKGFFNDTLTLLQLPLPGHGQGRLSVLDQPVTMSTAIQKIKDHLGLTHLRLALGQAKTLGKAICSGAKF